jgi:hypothetical protein
MKNLIALMIFAVSSAALADAPILVRYDFAVENTSTSDRFDALKVEVTVDEDGVATARKYRHDEEKEKLTLLTVESDKLHSSTFGAVKRRLEPLYSTRLKVFVRRVTCKKTQRPTDAYKQLYVKNGSQSRLRLVLGAEGCWLQSIVRPSDAGDLAKARDLKERLKAVGEDLLNL